MTEKIVLTNKQTERLANARFAGDITDGEVDGIADEAQAFQAVQNDAPLKRKVFGPGPFEINPSKKALKIIRKIINQG